MQHNTMLTTSGCKLSIPEKKQPLTSASLKVGLPPPRLNPQIRCPRFSCSGLSIPISRPTEKLDLQGPRHEHKHKLTAVEALENVNAKLNRTVDLPRTRALPSPGGNCSKYMTRQGYTQVPTSPEPRNPGLVEKYLEKIQEFQVSGSLATEDLGTLYEELFDDLGNILPEYEELFAAMKKLAQEHFPAHPRRIYKPMPLLQLGGHPHENPLTTHKIGKKTIGSLTQPNPEPKLQDEPGLERDTQHEQEFGGDVQTETGPELKPLLRTLKPVVRPNHQSADLGPLLSSSLSRNHVDPAKDYMVIANLEKVTTELPAQMGLTPEPKSLRRLVPKLKLSALTTATLQDYNDEFYSKIDEFSPSWRANALQTRTLEEL